MRIPLIVLSLLCAPAFAAPLHDELHEQIEHVTEAIAQHPFDGALLLERAELLRLDKSFRASLSDLERAADLGVERPNIDLVRALVARDLGRNGAALKRSQAVLTSDDASWGVRSRGWLLRIELLEDAGRHSDAILAWSALIAQSARPEPDWFLSRARLQDPEAALWGLEWGLDRLGPIPALLLEIASLEERLGRVAEACATLGILAEASPRKETWLTRQGDLLLRAHLPRKANEHYRAAREALGRLPRHLRRTPSMRTLEHTLDRHLATGSPQRTQR